MRLTHKLRFYLLSPALLVALLPSAHAQQTYKLVEKSAVGDMAQIEDDMTMNVTTTMPKTGDAPVKVQNTSQTTAKFLQSLLSKDATGKADGLRRTYTVNREVKNVGNGEQTVTSPLQGKTFIIRRKGNKVVVTGPAGQVSQEVRANLQDAFDDPVELLPNHAVSIGQEWKGDAHKLGQTAGMQVFRNITLKVQLADIAPFDGHRCAHLRVTMRMEMPVTDKLVMQINLAGDGYLALDIERMLGIDLSGPISLTGSDSDSAAPAPSLNGTARMKFTQHWLKVAGKPIAAN